MDQFGIFGDDRRKSFKVLGKVIGKQDGQNMVNIDFIIGNKLVSDETEITSRFNNYFVTVGKSLTKNTNSDVNPLDYIQSNSVSRKRYRIACTCMSVVATSYIGVY